MRIAAIDQGTTSTRVLVVDEHGGADIARAIRHHTYHPHPGWVEQSAEELLSNMSACVETAGNVDAMGIDNQGESCLAWDAKTGEALSPVIAWQDNRTEVELNRLRADGAQSLTLERAGLPIDPYFSASKLAWLLKHNRKVRNARKRGTLRLGTTDAYFLDRLTGHFATDTTTASRTSLMNLQTGQWDDALCKLFDVPVECLPEIRSTVGDFGQIGNVPVTASVVDQQAALYGHGCRKSGDAKITFGTGAFALTLTGEHIVRVPDQGLVPTVAWRIGDKITYALEGGVYDASAAVEWGGRLGLFEDLAEISAFESPAAIASGLVFVPALSGLACPHWDRTAGAMWIGMRASTSRQDMCQAMLEGVAMCAAQVMHAMSRHVDMASHISVDGGLARNTYFAHFLADVLGTSVRTQRFHELTSFGCAALAALGYGVQLQERRNPSIIFKPRQPTETIAAWHNTFSQAIQRSRGWR
ncbi:FGGY family carbohydrate kinase [Pandoraea sp. ISTKB]|uniref:FGGY family carbohydrate kinase n=1 Tax=Pandoraea sp. ISTKB TaxID=1586708 RepID=UPI000847B8CF|nr:FGGY family carbohydrate kinase [Pandoraea sp. ISTKB]ODP34201.1 glycerol kinase [Pandoraea sp. ISTKB]